MDRGDWQAVIHEVAKSQARLRGRVPNRPKTITGPWPQGLETLVLGNTRSRE